jgi:hypothetical protein
MLIKLVVSTSRINYKKYLSSPKNLSVCTFGEGGFATYFLDDGDRNFGLEPPADEDFADSYFTIFCLRGQFQDVY